MQILHAVLNTINHSIRINNHGYQGCVFLILSVCKKKMCQYSILLNA